MYAGIVSSKIDLMAYGIYSIITNTAFRICTDHVPKSQKIMLKRIENLPNTIGYFNGKYIELQKKTKYDNEWDNACEIKNCKVIRLLNIFFRTSKFVNYFLANMAEFHFIFQRDIFLHSQNADTKTFLFPHFRHYIIAGEKHLNKDQYSYSIFLTLINISLTMLSYMTSTVKNLLYIPVLKKRLDGKIIKPLSVPGKGLNSDIFPANGKAIKTDDIIFYGKSKSRKNTEEKAYAQAVAEKRKLISINGKIFNIGKEYLLNIFLNTLAAPFFLMLFLSAKPHLLQLSARIFKDSSAYLRIFSFCNTAFWYDQTCIHSHIPTILANLLRTKSLTFFYSDICAFPSFDFKYMVTDTVFVWGEEFRKQFENSESKEIYPVGCKFKKYNEEEKTKLKKLILDSTEKKLITFYDSSISPGFIYTEKTLSDFIGITISTMQKFPDTLIAFKPKENARHENWEILRRTGVKVFDPAKYDIEDIINISDLNIGMGMNSAITISLILGIPGIYYDIGNNYYHPLSKYENSLVYREKAKLLKGIKNFMCGKKFQLSEYPELRELNTAGIDSTEEFRYYINNGKLINPNIPNLADNIKNRK